MMKIISHLFFLMVISFPAWGAGPPFDKAALPSLDAAIRVACPDIEGVDANGVVQFKPSATCQQQANAVVAAFVPPPPVATSVQINSTGFPAVNGAYKFDAETTNKVQAIALYIKVNGKFPAGLSQMPFPDASGSMHTFPNTDVFMNFASALADFTTAFTLGMNPHAPVVIP